MNIEFCRMRAAGRLSISCAILLSLSLTSCNGFFVSENTVVSIAITPASPTLQVAGTQQFTATGTTAGGASVDVTAGATWTSSTPSVATVSSGGLATAVAAGTTTITAGYQKGSAQTLVTVP